MSDSIFTEKIKKLQQREIIEFTLDEVIHLINFLNFYHINTLSIQRSGSGESALYFCKITD